VLLDGAVRADTPITLFKSFAGNVSFTGTLKTMRTKNNNADPCAITNGSMNMVLSGVPNGATILNAQLYWAGSGSNPDYTVSFDGVNITRLRRAASPRPPMAMIFSAVPSMSPAR
jgi:hypothetical protein